jgi:hypothetical protein
MSQLVNYFDGIMTLTGDIGGAVGYDANGNTNLLGGIGIDTTGTPGTYTMTVSVDGTVPTSFLTDDTNSAIPALNVLTVAGGNNIYTSSAGSTVTIDLNGTTDHAIQLGNATGSLTSLGLGTASQILQSSGAGVDPSWSTATYPSTVGAGDILVASAANTITALNPNTAGYVLTDNGAGVAPSWQAASGGTVTSVTAGTNLSDSGTAADPVIDLEASISGMTNVIFANGGAIQTDTTTAHTAVIQAYDVDGTAYKTFITLTNGDTPTCDLDTDVTINSKYIYRADGTDIPVADGGTGVSSITAHTLLVGDGTNAINEVAAGSTGEVLAGSTGADPAFTATPSVTSLTATTVYGTTFDTNVAAAGVTLSGTTLSADGTDANIDINITAKGTGQVIIDDLQLTTDLAVTEGGTGASSLTDHSVLFGSGTSAITASAALTDGQLVIGDSGSDPSLATLTEGVGIDVTNGSGTITVASTGTTLNEQTDDYTLVLGDAGKVILMNKATAVTLTVPKDSSVAFPTGTMIGVIAQGAGTVTIDPVDGDVTINSIDDNTDISDQHGSVLLIKTDDDEWNLSGSLS